MNGDRPHTPSTVAAARRRRLAWEVALVLALSLGRSAVFAVLDLLGKVTSGTALADQRAVLNAPASDRSWLDLCYQLAGLVLALAPVALVVWLLAEHSRSAARALGLHRPRLAHETGQGLLLAAAIGIPGLAFYALGRALGITADVIPTTLGNHWWTVPVLIDQAARNPVQEEVVVVVYLTARQRRLGRRWPPNVVVCATLRGAYHLYQGYGPFLGNAVMGLVFTEWFRRTRRLLPLVIAHTFLDLVSFVGYQVFAGQLGLR